MEPVQPNLDNTARLHAAGVLVAIKAKRDFNSLRPIRLNAGTAVSYGLPYEAALAAITINPARIWGIADRAGSLDVGKDANVVIWNGDPLETRSWPLAVFIRGIEQPDTSVCAGQRATTPSRRSLPGHGGMTPAGAHEDPDPPAGSAATFGMQTPQCSADLLISPNCSGYH